MNALHARRRRLVWIAGLLFGTLLGGGCTSDQPGSQFQLRTDMYTQPSYRHNEDPLPEPPGTVPTTGIEAPVADSASAAQLHNPYTFGPGSADTAKVLFETYCSPCHGVGAKGDGLVASKFQTPPDLTAPKYVHAPDGYLYWVARYGIRIMPPQSENTTARERWLIISHLRSLQKQ
jgi:mono/diheme cytochrome c family protein